MLFYVILLFLNLILIFFLKKKEIKNLLFKKKIPEVLVKNIHPIFKTDLKNLNFPTEEYITKFFIDPSGSNIIGMTSDLEAWILCMMSKISKNIFEFGTCSGKTTYLLALNSPVDAKITTLTIKSDEKILITKGESKTAFRNIFNESKYEEFMFTNTDIEKKISETDKRSKNYTLTNEAIKLMEEWAHRQKEVFSEIDKITK